MKINPQGFLIDFLLKNQLNLNIPQKEALENNQTLQYSLTSPANNFLTITLPKSEAIQIPLEQILKEIEVKPTDDNLLILKVFLKNKIPLNKENFNSLAKTLAEIPEYKEEIFEMLLNPFLRVIIFNEEKKEKASIDLRQKQKKTKDLEINILYQHPKAKQILIRILWGNDTLINIYFDDRNIRDFYATRINLLKKKLPFNYKINLDYRESLLIPENKTNYYRIDFKI